MRLLNCVRQQSRTDTSKSGVLGRVDEFRQMVFLGFPR